MIDIHLHILPGIDDGPTTLQESIRLAEVLVQEGIHTAVATPHYNDEFAHCPAAEIQERVSELQMELDRHNIPLRIFAGHEALIQPGLVEDIQAGRIATLNGSRYLLLELWNNSWLAETEQVIFELRAFGIIPILAHPERCRVFQKEWECLASLLRQGALVQITANSLVGMQGRTAQRTAKTLLKRGLVHCIASDAHGLRRRPPAIAESLRQVIREIGQVNMQQLIESCPRMIVNNELCRA